MACSVRDETAKGVKWKPDQSVLKRAGRVDVATREYFAMMRAHPGHGSGPAHHLLWESFFLSFFLPLSLFPLGCIMPRADRIVEPPLLNFKSGLITDHDIRLRAGMSCEVA